MKHCFQIIALLLGFKYTIDVRYIKSFKTAAHQKADKH